MQTSCTEKLVYLCLCLFKAVNLQANSTTLTWNLHSLGRWINLRVPFQEVYGDDRCNLKQAVEKAGLTWQGRAHCGLDDAKNTARLLALIMHKGFKFAITNSLAYSANDGSFTLKHTPEKPPFFSPQPQKLLELRPQLPQYHHFCYCGVISSSGVVRKPGPKQGSLFFGCGNWTAARGARCHYFEWASPWLIGSKGRTFISLTVAYAWLLLLSSRVSSSLSGTCR